MKIELQEIKGPAVDADIRQLISSSEVQGSAPAAGEESVSIGPEPPRESDLP